MVSHQERRVAQSQPEVVRTPRGPPCLRLWQHCRSPHWSGAQRRACPLAPIRTHWTQSQTLSQSCCSEIAKPCHHEAKYKASGMGKTVSLRYLGYRHPGLQGVEALDEVHIYFQHPLGPLTGCRARFRWPPLPQIPTSPTSASVPPDRRTPGPACPPSGQGAARAGTPRLTSQSLSPHVSESWGGEA